MPTRRVLGLVIVTMVAMQPVLGMIKLWATRKLGEATPGTVTHGTAEVLAVVA
jgi:hypothetical protein